MLTISHLLRARRFQTTVVAKLSAANHGLYRRCDPVTVGSELLDHLVEQWLIGQLHRSPQGKADQFATKLANKIVTALLEQVPAQPVNALEFCSIS